MIGKPNTLRPSLKMTIPQPLPLDITPNEITLIFGEREKTTICKIRDLIHLRTSASFQWQRRK